MKIGIKKTTIVFKRRIKMKKQHLSSKKREILLVAQKNISIEKTFNDLNDDCIEELLRRLPTKEIAKMSMVNVRINTLSKNLFKRLRSSNRFKIILFGERPEIERIAIDNSVKAFGKFIEKLQISGAHPLSQLHFNSLRMINQYCGKSLQYLKICGFNVHNETAGQMRNLMQNIQTITLKTCSTTEENDIFDLLLKYCNNLRYLNIVSCKFNPESWLNRTYDHLESIFFRYQNGKTIEKYLQNFFQLNQRMKQVTIQANLTKLPANLATNALNMESIAFGIHKTATVESFEPIFHLARLKELTIYRGFSTKPDVWRTIVERFGANNTLETFGIYELEISIEICRLIANMTRLKALKFWQPNSIDENGLKILASALVNLDSLYVCGDLVQLEMICVLVKKFPGLKSLYLHNSKFYKNTTDKQLAEIIESRRVVANDWYNPLTIYVRDNGFETRKLVTIFEHNFLYNKYINLVAIGTDSLTRQFYGIVN